VPAYLRLADARASHDAPTVRLGVTAQVALDLAGARVLRSAEAGPPTKPRDDAFGWTLRHDRFVADLVATAARRGARTSAAVHHGIVVSDDARTVAHQAPAVAGTDGMPILWAAPAQCLLDPPRVPPAALTLTTADAAVLVAAGIRATSLLAWPRPVGVPPRPRRVVVAVAVDGGHALAAVLDALTAELPGRPVVDVLPDAPLTVRGTRRAPMHPWARSEAVRSCDLLLTLGRSASTDLAAAEAASTGAAVHRIDPSAVGDGMAGVLPTAEGPTPVDPEARADALHVPVRSLAGWLDEVSRSHDEEL
jgi:hypothetical protein